MVSNSISLRYQNLQQKAERNGEPWEMTLTQFDDWASANKLVDPSRKQRMTVTRIDTNVPWNTNNIHLVPYHKLWHQPSGDVQNLTVAQWLQELKANKNASRHK